MPLRPAGAGEDQQAHVVPPEEVIQLGELAPSPEQSVRLGREADEGLAWAQRDAQARVLLQDQALQLAQLSTWSKPELIAKSHVDFCVERQRPGLPAATVESEHRLRLQPLTQRMRRGKAAQLCE